MDKKKSLTIVLLILFVLSAGFLYSCKETKEQETQVLLQNQETGLSNTLVSAEEVPEEEKIGNTSGETEDSAKTEGAFADSIAPARESGDIYVHVCGAVKNPDVYKVKEQSRLIDIIRLAGGLREDAADDYVNLAVVVEDGQRIYIPAKEEVENWDPREETESSTQEKSLTAGSSEGLNGKININTAGREELMTLSGIGEAKADSIIAYRQEKGGFKTIEEIKKIDGIKNAVFNKISDLITVE